MATWIKRSISIIDKLNSILAVFAAVILVLMSIATGVSALSRQIGFYFRGILELTEFSLIWITFCGAAWLLRKGGHIAIDVVVTKLNPKVRALLDIVTYSISVFLFMLIVWYGAKVTIFHFQTGFIMAGSVLQLPKAPIELIIPLGSALLVIELFRKIYSRFMDWKKLGAG